MPCDRGLTGQFDADAADLMQDTLVRVVMRNRRNARWTTSVSIWRRSATTPVTLASGAGMIDVAPALRPKAA